MAGSQDDDTARFEVDPAGDEQASPSAATGEGPLITGDPLGLGKTPPPDAPSRKARPKIVALLGEFFRMSRATAILLIAFVVISALYLVVRENPVLQVRAPSGPATSESTGTTSATPSGATSSGQTPTEETSVSASSEDDSDEPTQSEATDGTTAPSATPQGGQTATVVPTPGDAGQQQAPAQQQQQQQQVAPAEAPAGTGSP